MHQCKIAKSGIHVGTAIFVKWDLSAFLKFSMILLASGMAVQGFSLGFHCGVRGTATSAFAHTFLFSPEIFVWDWPHAYYRKKEKDWKSGFIFVFITIHFSGCCRSFLICLGGYKDDLFWAEPLEKKHQGLNAVSCVSLGNRLEKKGQKVPSRLF